MENIELCFEKSLEIIFAAARVSLNHEYEEAAEEGLPIDPEIDKWVREVLGKIDPRHKKLLDFYFDQDGYLGLGLLRLQEKFKDSPSVQELISFMEDISASELSYYLLLGAYDGELAKSDIKQFNDYQQVYKWITDNCVTNSRGSWKVFKLISNPEEAKEELIAFLNYFYSNFFKDYYEKKEIEEFMNSYLEENRDLLKRSFIKLSSRLLSPELKDDFFKKDQIRVNISYFAGIGHVFVPEQMRLAIGYKYPEKIDNNSSIRFLALSRLFKALSDENRLKILLKLKKESKYLTQLSDSLEISGPSVKYHLEKLMEMELIEIEKSEKRIYYCLKKSKLNNMINELKNTLLRR